MFSGRNIKLIIYALFFGSGFSGLVYEVIWVRMLHTILGSTTYAVSIVLTAFMAGLAIGSFLAGRWIEKKVNALKIYAWIEVGIGFFAFLSPIFLNGLNSFYIWMHNQMSLSLQMVNIVRFILSFGVLIVPTALMGATLPVLSKFFVRTESSLGEDIGGLYGFNTLGAMMGCFFTGFFLIQAMGIRLTIFLAAVINVLIAVIIFVLHKRVVSTWIFLDEAQLPKTKSRKQKSQKVYPKSLLQLVLLVFAVSGFASLGYEVLWTRAIGFFAGNTSYAFSTMLTTFLFGLALGSILAMRFCDRIKDLVTGLGLAEILIGFSAILTIPMFARIFFQIESPAFRGSEATPLGLKFTYSSLAMLLPTLVMGATFPIVSKIYTRLNRVGQSIGNIYSINTLGAILGSAVAGFILIPIIGIQKSILLLAAVNIVIGIILIASSPDATKKSKYSFLAPVVILAIILGAVVPVRGKIFSSVKRPAMPQGNSIYYKEGVTHIVEIIEDVKDGTRHLILDGGINASTAPIGVGRRVHMLIAELPLLLHKDPKSILLIALGSGMTAGATLAFDNLETIDCAEISPDVVRAADYFAQWNHDVVNSPRFNLLVEDGRNFVLTTPKEYDVITTGIIHPKHSAGNASLYSKDYYQICKSKLKEEGIICQWAPLNGLKVEEFKMILKTFQEVFPQSTLWFAQTFGSWSNVNALLIGTQYEFKIDYNRLQKKFQEKKIASDLESEGIDNIFEFLDGFIMAKSTLASFASDQIEITTDDRPLLEFGSVEMHYTEILDQLASKREPVWPYLNNVGKSPEDSTGIYAELQKYFEVSNKCIQGDIKGLRKDYNQAIADYGAAREMASENEDVRTQLLELQKNAHNFLVKRFLKQRIRFPSDVEKYLQMVKINPNDAEAVFRIGYFYQQVGWLDAAISQYQEALRLEPNKLQVRHNLAVVYDNKGWVDKAVEELKIVIKMNPSFSEPYAYLGFIYERQADTAKAIELFEKALEIDPENQTAKRHLSKLK